MTIRRLIDRRAMLKGATGTAAALASGRAFAESAAPKVSTAALRTLQAKLPGQVVLPGDAAFAALAQPNNLRYADVQPVAIVRCTSAEDVSKALLWTRDVHMPFVTRSGGHSYAGFSTTPGLLIDVSRMNRVTVDAATDTVDISGGARHAQLASALRPAGRTLTHGRCMGVGVAGFLLGGGIGFGMRDRGLGCDAMLETEVVLADGRIVTASAQDNADLFWACKGGGGGNFGVHTRFRLASAPAEPVTLFRLSWERDADAVVAELLAALAKAPDRLGSCITIAPVTAEEHAAGRDARVSVLGQLRGPVDEARALFGPIMARYPTDSATLETMNCWTAQLHLAEDGRPGFYQERSTFAGAPLGAKAIAALMTAARRLAATSKPSEIRLFQMGGQVSAMAPDATAFVHRRATWLATTSVAWGAADDAEAVTRTLAWLDATHDTLRGHLGGGAYLNFADPTLKDWPAAYYGANLDRLRRVKARVDPASRFRFAQAIAPAAPATPQNRAAPPSASPAATPPSARTWQNDALGSRS